MEKMDERKVLEVFSRGRELIARDSGHMIVSQQPDGIWIVSWHLSGGAHWSPLAVARDKVLSVAIDKLSTQLADHPNRDRGDQGMGL